MNPRTTIVFIDLTSSSAAYEALGNQMAARLVSRITQWMSRVCEGHGGRVVKMLGDGVLAQFPTAIQAVSATVFAQQRYAAEREKWPVSHRMELKIGMASGAVVKMGGDSYGDTVNLASRLSDMGGAEAIWADESTIAQLDSVAAHRIEVPNQDTLLHESAVRRRSLGRIHIPGLEQPRTVFQILWDDNVPTSFLTEPAGLGDLDDDTADAAAPATLTLSWLNAQRVFKSTDGELFIGRAMDNQFIVDDGRVSRRHARIRWIDGAFELADLSSYGTWVRFSAADAGEVALRRNTCYLHSAGEIALNVPFSDFTAPVVMFRIESAPAAVLH